MSNGNGFQTVGVRPAMFNGKNWVVWKFQLEQVMRANGLLDLLDGSSKRPIKVTESDKNGRTIVEKQKDIDHWNRRDGWAMSILSTSVEPEIIEEHVMATSTHELWSKLKANQEPKTEVSKQALWTHFYDLKKSSNETVNQFVARVVQAAQKLRNASINCDDEQVISRIFYGLSDDYLVIEEIWESLEPSSRTIDKLTAKLKVHEERLNRQEETTETTAFQARQVRAPKTNNKDDDKKKKKKKKNDDWQKKAKCFECGKKGHIARDCSHKKNDDQDDGNKKASALCSIVDANVPAHSWVVDSGATCYMTSRREWFNDYEPYVAQIKLANGQRAQSAGRGTILIRAFVEGEWSDLRLVNVLHVPSFDLNLLSTRKIMARGYKMIGTGKSIKFEKNRRVVLAAVLRDEVFVVLISRSSETCCAARAGSLRDWHERLGHIHVNAIRTMAPTEAVEGMQIDDDEENFFCEPCVIAKQSRPVHPKSERKRNPEAGEFVHKDLCSGFETRSLGGALHFILFEDDATGYRTVEFLSCKSEVQNMVKNYIRQVERQTGRKLRTIRSDNGGEYIAKAMKNFVENEGINYQWSSAYVPEQNGRAERKMRTIVESTRSMIKACDLPNVLCAETVATAVNRIIKSHSELVAR